MCSWYIAESLFVALCLIPRVMPRVTPRTVGVLLVLFILYNNTILFDTLLAIVMLGESSL